MIDRTVAPLTSLPETLVMPDERAQSTACGVRLHTIRAVGADVVRLTLVFAAGSALQSKPYEAMTATVIIVQSRSTLVS